MSVLDLLPILITAFGFYMLIKLRFFFIIHPIKTAGKMLRLFKDKSSRASLFLALAGTLGVGNIVGVAYGISVGGVGSVFWIFVSSIFAAVIKYSESALAADRKAGEHGGMMYVIKSSFSKIGGTLGSIYAILCILLSFSMGCALQSESFVSSVSTVKIPDCIFALAFAIPIIAVIKGGAKKISSVTSVIIPMATLIYISICLSVILKHISELPSAVNKILAEAFNFPSITGGVSAFFGTKAIKEGYARGLLSNEAGAGTSSMAQARSNMSAAEVGLLGILEVFFDTTVLCTLTGLAVAVSGVDASGFSGGIEIISSVFKNTLGYASTVILTVLIFAFAFSTVVCWYYYGSECLEYLFKTKKSGWYTALFVFFTLFGFIVSTDVLIAVSDVLLFFMSVITVAVLYKNSERILVLSERHGLLKKSDFGKGSKSKLRKSGNL